MSRMTLEQLCDERDIREVLTRYCRATDRCDAELLRSVYWPDATDDHVVFSGNAMEYVDYSVPMLKQHTRATLHSLSNIWIKLDGDTALVESYVQAYHLLNTDTETKQEVVVGGRYLDRLERRNDEWRIAERNVVIDWEQNGAAMMSPEEIERVTAPGKRDPDERSYRLFANKTLR